jgi:hypothetical protein
MIQVPAPAWPPWMNPAWFQTILSDCKRCQLPIAEGVKRGLCKTCIVAEREAGVLAALQSLVYRHTEQVVAI